jgi:hypothetical protein
VTPVDADPIVEEIRQIRDAYAKAHGYDLKAIVADLQTEQVKHGRRVVSLSPKRLTRADEGRDDPRRGRPTRG